MNSQCTEASSETRPEEEEPVKEEVQYQLLVPVTQEQEAEEIAFGDTKFSCDNCNEIFPNLELLERHKIVHAIICDICDKEFKSALSLKRHQKVHLQTVDFPCNVCSKIMGTGAALRRHMKIHSDNKPHACDICDKRFYEAGIYDLFKPVFPNVWPTLH